MFLDSSAIVAILTEEPERDSMVVKIKDARELHTSPLVVFESTLAVARLQKGGLSAASKDLTEFLSTLDVSVAQITLQIGEEAVAAHERYGKGRHPARLNMGDCFSYACARVLKVPLLCKGDDFIHTDIRIA